MVLVERARNIFATSSQGMATKCRDTVGARSSIDAKGVAHAFACAISKLMNGMDSTYLAVLTLVLSGCLKRYKVRARISKSYVRAWLGGIS